MDNRTFTFLGVRYTAPASLDANIRDWFAHNAPTATCAPIPADARFSTVLAALTPSTAAPLPAWCASIDSFSRNLIYYCTAVCACGIAPASRKKEEKHCFSRKNVCFTCKFPQKYVPLQCQKEKEVTTIKTGGNCNSAPRL